MDRDDVPPTCLSCAACCFSELDAYVRVTGDDYERLGEAAAAMTEFHANRAFMRMVDGHCVALRIDPIAGSFACAIYGRRPAACRDLERGGPACRGELSTKSDRPRRALAVARAG